MDPTKIEILNMVMNAGLMVKFVLLLLLFFSVTSWTIMIIKYRYIKRAYDESAKFTDFFWKSKNLSNAFAKAKQLHGSPDARNESLFFEHRDTNSISCGRFSRLAGNIIRDR